MSEISEFRHRRTVYMLVNMRRRRLLRYCVGWNGGLVAQHMGGLAHCYQQVGN